MLYTYMCVYYTLPSLLSTEASDFREFIICEAKRWNVDVKRKWSYISGSLCFIIYLILYSLHEEF